MSRQQVATRWLSIGHQNIWDSDGFTDDVGKFYNKIADSMASEILSDTELKKVALSLH